MAEKNDDLELVDRARAGDTEAFRTLFERYHRRAYTLAAGASGLAAYTYIDRFDRKRLLLVLYGLFAMSTLACGVAPKYGSLMGARSAAGSVGGVLTARHSIAARATPSPGAGPSRSAAA